MPRRRRPSWLAVAALLLGLAVSFAPMLASGFAVVPGDLQDPRLVLFLLEHSFGFVSGRPLDSALWSPPMFHPVPGVAAYTELFLSSAGLYWPLRFAGLEMHHAFQVWLLLALALDYLVFYLFLRRGLGIPAAASAVGAYLFAFAASRLADVYHPQNQFDAFYALAFLAAALALRSTGTRRRGWVVVFFAAVTLQLYHAYSNFFFLYLFLGLAVAVGLTLREPRRRLLAMARRDGAFVVVMALVALVAMSPAAERYLEVKDLVGGRPAEDVEHFAPRLHTWLVPTQGNRLYGWIHDATGDRLGTARGWGLGLGLVTPALALWGLWRHRRRPLVRVAVGVAAIAVVLATAYPGVGTIWSRISFLIYGAEGIRALYRVGFGLQVLFGVGVALAVTSLARRRPWLPVLVLVLVAAEQSQRLPTYDAATSRARIAEVAHAVGPGCRSFFVSVEPGTRQDGVPEDAMLAALVTGVPTVDGRSGQWPPGYGLERLTLAPRRLGPRLATWIAETCLEDEVCWLVRSPDGVREVARLPGRACRPATGSPARGATP